MGSMLRLLIFLFFLSSAPLKAQAQSHENVREWMPRAIGDKNWRPYVGFDARRSFFNDRGVRFGGLRLGALHRGVHRFGIAFYWMSQGEIYPLQVDLPDASPDGQVSFEAGFVSFFYERVIMKQGKWELAAPVYFGGGNIKGTYKDVYGEFKPYFEEPFSILGLGGMLKYRLLPWLEPGVGGGQNIVFASSPEVKQTLQKPYFAFKVSVLIGEFYRTVIKGEEAEE